MLTLIPNYVGMFDRDRLSLWTTNKVTVPTAEMFVCAVHDFLAAATATLI